LSEIIEKDEKFSDRLVTYFDKNQGSIRLAELLRRDLITMLKSSSSSSSSLIKSEVYKNVARRIFEWLSNVISEDHLQLHNLTYEHSTADIIHKVTVGDTVLPSQTIQDIRNRFQPGRKCFAFTHESYPNDPLAFIHVALTNQITSSIRFFYYIF
jgi:hypothetical protein